MLFLKALNVLRIFNFIEVKEVIKGALLGLRQLSTDSSLILIWVGDNFIPLPHCWSSLNNSETVKALTLAFWSINRISLETFVSNLVSLTYPSLQIFGQTQTEVFPISRLLVDLL